MRMMLLLNALANAILGFSMTMFYLYIFADKSKVVHKWKFIMHWTLKFGMVAVIIGTLFNTLSFDHVTYPQLFVNVGFAFLFVWAYLFHKKMFDARHEQDKAKRKKK